MNYFRLDISTNLAEIGEYPQSIHGKYQTAWNAPDSLRMVFKEKVVNREIEIPGIIIETKAKVTDLISTGYLSFMLVMSTKLKAIIEDMNYPGIQFFETVLHQKNTMLQGFWIASPYLFRNDYVDYASSGIARLSSSRTQVKVTSREEFDFLFETGKQTGIIHIIDTPKLLQAIPKEDFFLLDRVSGGVGYYVSENLKQRIEAAGCTGIEFYEV